MFPNAKPVTLEHIKVHGVTLEGNLGGDAVDRDRSSSSRPATRGYTINVGAKSQTATILQNANHTMRQLSITDSIFSNQNQTCVFGYDEFLRLTSDKCGSVWGAAYTYDLFGNTSKMTVPGSPGTSFQPTYNISNHYATIPAGAPSYDSVGNLLNDSFHQYTWDIEGNPATIDTYSFTYDALNRRVEYGTVPASRSISMLRTI